MWTAAVGLTTAAVSALALAPAVVAEESSPAPLIAAALPALPDRPAQPVTPAGVEAAVSGPLSGGALGSQVGVVVADGITGELLYSQAEEQPRVPASATKILTAAAVLAAFGVDQTLTTSVVREPDGRLVIIGAGDPSLRAGRNEPGIGATLENLAQLTAASLAAQGDSSPVRIGVDISAFSGPELAVGWDRADVSSCYVRPVVALMTNVAPGAPCRPGISPDLAAAGDFAGYLEAAGIAVEGDPERLTASAGAVAVAEVQSPPISALVEQMVLDSDNTGAEMLAHLAGGVMAGEASFAGGAEATSKVLTQWGVPTEGLVLDDGSGMSSDNRVAPATVAGVLHEAATPDRLPTLWPITSGLPAAGFEGTLAQRFSADVAGGGRGDVRAKTGTLVGVSALAGQVVTESGQLLHFVFLADATGSTAGARAQLDRAAAALAECGCS